MNVAQFSDYSSLREKRNLARRRELVATSERLSNGLLTANRLAPEDRKILARNVGRLAEERAASKNEIGNAKAVLRRAFEGVAAAQGRTEERWPKRLRWSRLEGEDGLREELSGKGAAYLELARAIAVTTNWDEARAVIRLADGTSFSPDISVVADEKVGAVGAQIATSITSLADDAIPGIRTYFETVERLGLTHPVSRRSIDGLEAISHFDTSVFVLNPWNGLGVEGQLVREEIQDGDPLTQESWGSASLLPSVRFATVTCFATIPTIDFSARPGVDPDDRLAFERLVGEFDDPDSQKVGSRIVSQSFDVFLVLGPGESTGGSLRLGLVVEAQDMADVIASDCYLPPDYRPASTGRWLIFDSRSWEADQRGSLLREREATIFWLHEMGARDILALVGKPQEFVFLRSMLELGSSDLEISPHIPTGGFTEADPRSLEGILDANVKYQSGEQNVVRLLFEDARKRMARLDQHLQGWRAEYHEATVKFQERRDEP